MAPSSVSVSMSRRSIRWRTTENGAIRYSRQQTVKIPPRSPPGLCANRLATATRAARHSTTSATSRVTRLACEVRSVSQTVASWTVSTTEPAHAWVTETDTT
jgi:hypothetical protein